MPSPSIRLRPERRRGCLRAAVAALVVGSLIVARPAPASAAPEAEAVRQSREHYRKGEEAYAAGRYDEAYGEFEKGYALAPRPVFLLNLAHTERRRGNLSNARALYLKFLLIEPQSKYAAEVKQVIQEIDSALSAEAATPAPAGPAEAIALPPAPPEPAAAAPPAAVIVEPLPPPRPIYRRWWVWATAGGVVVAGLATTLLLSRSSYQKEGSLGTLGTR
jgi:tetratricopeptide (TPR) repeat protein